MIQVEVLKQIFTSLDKQEKIAFLEWLDEHYADAIDFASLSPSARRIFKGQFPEFADLVQD